MLKGSYTTTSQGASEMPGIEIRNLTKRSCSCNGSKETVFEDFNLKISSSETIGLFGPNGCGKTTLLNMVAGIIKPDSGDIIIRGGKKSTVAYIFQDYRNSLFPWLTIRENIIFPLSIRGTRKKASDEKLERLRELVNIPFPLEKYPQQLSGGQQQYVAILRGLISDPAAMLIDEPFSALDYNNTMWLRDKMTEILETIKIPTMFVAHDLEHLVYSSDRICFLSNKPTRVVTEAPINFQRPRVGSMLNYYELQRIKGDLIDLFSGTKILAV